MESADLAPGLPNPLTRRTFLTIVSGGLLGTPLAAEAQSPRVPRIGVLSPGSPGPSPLITAFQQGLRDLGYIDRQSVVFEYRFAEAKPERLPMLAAELVVRGTDARCDHRRSTWHR